MHWGMYYNYESSTQLQDWGTTVAYIKERIKHTVEVEIVPEEGDWKSK